MNLTQSLFYTVPLISALCNLFLLLTFLNAKKDSLIRSFMNMLIGFTTWTLGSFFMRIGLYPSEYFWFQVSMISILLIPIFIYDFIYHYTEQQNLFTKVVLNIVSFLVAALNVKDLYIIDPHVMVTEEGQHVFTYGVSPLALLPVLLAAAVLFLTAKMVVQCIRSGKLPFSMFKYLGIGVIIMFAALLLECIPGIPEALPLDQFACMTNAILIYYTLYKKRVFTLQQLTSSGSTYLIAAVLSSLLLAASFVPIDNFFAHHLTRFVALKDVTSALIVSLVTILIYNLLRQLTNNLFIKTQQIKENALGDFSTSITKTLNRREILTLFSDIIQEYTDVQTAYIFLHDEEEHMYQMELCTDKMRSTAYSIAENHPLVKRLSERKENIEYSNFKYTVDYKSMWEEEKQVFLNLNTSYVIPILCDDNLIGFVVLAAQPNQKAYSYNTISFLESAASIVSMALRNSTLYEQIQKEAQLDALTNTYNRRYFSQQLELLFEQWKHHSLTLILINFDDFHLYNELYGSNEADDILVAFSNILKTTIASEGLIGRYSGKEFCIALPVCSVEEAERFVTQIRQKLELALNSSDKNSKRLLTFSAGISSYPATASNIKELLTYANMAVYAGKKSGKNKTIIYSGNKQEIEDSAFSYAHIADIGHEYAPTIYALTAAIDAKDHHTFSHSVNVSYLATQLARAIDLNEEHVEMIRQAGLLHDIGKISIPDSILAKTTPLTKEEYEIIKGHVENSITMIRHLPSLDYVIPIVISHHERYDGQGYPRGLSGEDIPIGGRCLALADAFDAIVSKRPYKEAISITEALEEIERNLGKQFDPELGRTFVELIKSGTISTDIYE